MAKEPVRVLVTGAAGITFIYIRLDRVTSRSLASESLAESSQISA